MKRLRVKILLYTLLGFLVVAGIFLRFYLPGWFGYVSHLAKHQIHVFTQRYSIEEIFSEKCKIPETPGQIQNHKEQKENCLIGNIKLNETGLNKLRLAVSAREYARKIYELEDTDIYTSFVPLPRRVLGWNITVAHPLKLEVKNFYFPFIGDFGYLGFFDEEVLKSFEEKYTREGFDLHRSTMAGYTSLGYFEDPVFSSYLNFPDLNLLYLIFHEIAHLKVYFEDDTFFSESLASFIEKHAVQDYIKEVLQSAQKIPVQNPVILKREYDEFNREVNSVKKKLEELFAQNIPDKEKLIQKKDIYTDFKQKLKKLAAKNRYLQYPRYLIQIELNNAILLQISRYSPPQKSSFDTLLFDTCNKNYSCWFKELEKLRKLSPAEKKSWLTNKNKKE